MPFHADDEHRFDFRDGSESYPVYADGVGPGVLIMHELPGLTARCVDLAGRVQDGGFRVYAPLFFGRPGETNEVIGSARAFWFLCVRREIEVLATQRSSRISGWVRALCRRIHAECAGEGVGVIGLCLTGGLVLSAMLEPAVLVPVASEPAVPLPWTAARRAAPGCSPEDLEGAVARAAQAPLLAYRFRTDTKSPPERFETLRSAFGTCFRGTEIPPGPGVRANAHSVLTDDFDPAEGSPTHKALDEILEAFRSRLRGSAS